MSTCKARQVNDELQCGACGLTWDVKDPDPPECPQGQDIVVEEDDGMDSMTRSSDDEFHAWAVDNNLTDDLDNYELAELAWTAGKWSKER